MPPTDSTGIRNKNYLNVKNGTSPWIDAGGKNSQTDERGHAVFTDPAYGIRAGILQLRAYFTKHNLRTIAEILARWAPATDTVGSLPGAPPNSPLEYATFVAGHMNFGFNDKLDTFKEDGSIGNISRLRDLFLAMAEYENGQGFKVPQEEFDAGLELVQPGITADEPVTDSSMIPAGAPADGLEAMPAAPAASAGGAAGTQWEISGSVGRPEKGAVNKKADVETVQQMLRTARMILEEPRMDPGEIDGQILANSSQSATVKAIEVFQSRFMVRPDGVISVGGRTWRELISVLEGDQPNAAAPAPSSGAGEFFFPLGQVPTQSWTDAPRSFASRRDSGRRAHAGCDLYAPIGTTIHAITSGTVVRGPYAFYAETFAIEIDHGSFLARYGEVQGQAFVRTGDQVRAGQPIAKVGRLVGISVPSAMLHLELYSKNAHGPLTVTSADSAKTPDGRSFRRRRDLMDPTPKLNEWKKNLPGA